MDKDLEPHSFKAFPTQTSQTGLENKEPTAVSNGNPYNLDLEVPPEMPQAFGGHALWLSSVPSTSPASWYQFWSCCLCPEDQIPPHLWSLGASWWSIVHIPASIWKDFVSQGENKPVSSLSLLILYENWSAKSRYFPISCLHLLLFFWSCDLSSDPLTHLSHWRKDFVKIPRESQKPPSPHDWCLAWHLYRGDSFWKQALCPLGTSLDL